MKRLYIGIRSQWQRLRGRVIDLLRSLLLQGLSPGTLASTLAAGTLASLFPVLGATSLLNLALGWALRMNHVLLQLLNQILGPLQLLMVLPYVRLGEWLWSADSSERFSIAEVLQAFSELSIGSFLERFAWAGVHAVSAWALSAPVVFFLLRTVLRPLLLRLPLPAASTAQPEARATLQ